MATDLQYQDNSRVFLAVLSVEGRSYMSLISIYFYMLVFINFF